MANLFGLRILKEKKMSDERYVVVTCISSFRERYVVPVSKLQELNPDKTLTTEMAAEWARDSVTMEEVKEFSQHWLGETILDTFVLDEERMLALFDRDNPYLKDWTLEQKLKYIHNWKENKDGTISS
jgi:hypothetical protein